MHLMISTKVSVNWTVVPTTLNVWFSVLGPLLLSFQTPERFHQRCSCIILNIYQINYITSMRSSNEQRSPTSLGVILLKDMTALGGYANRMKDHRLYKIIKYSELITGYHNSKAPRKHYKDCLKQSSSIYDNYCERFILTADCVTRRHIVNDTASSCEIFYSGSPEDKTRHQHHHHQILNNRTLSSLQSVMSMPH